MLSESTNISLPKELTSQGIQDLFGPGPHHHNKEFILQVIKLTDDCEQTKICYLSDGFVYVKGVLTEKAKMKAIRGELVLFDVLKLDWTQITLFGLEKDIAFSLKDCEVFGIRMLNTIGTPVSYIMYYHNDYTNKNGSSRICEGQKVEDSMTLDELLQNFPQVPKKWVLKAKITKKPDTINLNKPFMIIRLLDSNMKSIEGVFFGKQAREYYSLLKYNHEYLFSNGLIKVKKNNPSEFQIKFTEHSQIIPIETMKTITKETKSMEDQVKVKEINTLQNGEIVNINAKILRIKKMSRGRSLEAADQNFDVIQIVLWEQFTDQITEGQTYTFFNLRIKHYNGMVSLQSIRHKTQVRFSFKKIEKNEGQPKNENTNPVKRQMKSTFKDLIKPDDVMSIVQVVEMTIQSRMYVDVNGFLIINTYPDVNKFFKIECRECGSKQAAINPVCCRKCSSPQVSIRWNVRAQLVDEKQDIKVILNEEICQKLFKWYSREGFMKFHESVDEFMRRLEQASYIEGIYKIKINPYNGSVYYNVLEMYKEDSRVLLNKAYNQLKKAMKQYIESN